MMTFPVLVTAVAFLVAAGPLPAQLVWPHGTARISGVVLDSSTGKPIVRSHICREFELGVPYGRGIRCVSPDTLGRYVFDSLPEGRQIVAVDCSGDGIFGGRQLLVDTLHVGAGGEGRVDVTTDATGCDMRPFTSRRGLFRGVYVAGFEENSFRACNDSVSAWVQFTPAARNRIPAWPKPNDKHYPSVYVEWEGTIRGPWRYGHMGAAPFEVEVDRVLVVRLPKSSDCRSGSNVGHPT